VAFGDDRVFSTDRDLRYLSQAPIHGWQSPQGVHSMVPVRYNDFLNAISFAPLTENRLSFAPEKFRTGMNLASVRWVILPPSAPAPEGFRALGTVESLVVYENSNAFPRAFFVGEVKKAFDDTSVLGLIQQAPDLFRKRAWTTDSAAAGRFEVPPTPPRVASRTADAVRITLPDSPAGSFLVLTDNAFPGWSAHAGDRPIPIERVNGHMQGIRIPPHTTELRLEYYPPGLRLGAGISLAGLVLAVAAAWIGRRRISLPETTASSGTGKRRSLASIFRRYVSPVRTNPLS
jgi:hypothetical protein